jgi:phage shock protein PspC (stress-responsive transcriptional regulator)
LYCQRCGQDNPAEAQFCQRCGSRMVLIAPEASAEQRLRNFTNEIEQIVRRTGSKEASPDSGPRKGLGFFGPLVYALVLIVAVAIIGLIFEEVSHHGSFVHDLGSFLVSNLYYFFLATLLFGYMIQLTPQNPRGIEMLRPLATATAVAFSLWLAFGVFDILGRVYEIDALGSLADLVLIILPIIFILLLVIGYALVLSRGLERRAKQKVPYGPTPPRDLYRSGKERFLGGVGGGIAEYADTDPRVIRVFLIIFTAATLGIFALMYLVLWMLLPRDPHDQW